MNLFVLSRLIRAIRAVSARKITASQVWGSIATSLVVQGLGSLSPILTILFLAHLSGPATQGEFSTFKTWMDLVSSLLIFGFPQAFIYILNKNLTTRDHLLNASLLYAGASTALVIPFAAYSVKSGYNHLPDGRSMLEYCSMLALGMIPLVINRLVRAIYLTMDDGFLFSLITSAPAFFLMITVLTATLFNPFAYDAAFLSAGVLTLISTAIWIRRIVSNTPTYAFGVPRLPLRLLAVQSTHVFIQSVSFTLQPVITIYMIKWGMSAVTDVAFFTASTVVIAAVNAFFGIIAPVLFNRWSAVIDPASLSGVQRASDWVAVFFLLVGLASIPLYRTFVPLVFGVDYIGAVPAFELVSLALAPVAFTRTVASAIHAAGRPDINTISCLLRLGFSIGAQAAVAFAGALPPLTGAVAAWVIAEWVAALYSRHAGRRMLRWV